MEQLFVLGENNEFLEANKPNKKMKFMNQKFSSLDNCLNANFQYESMHSRLASHSQLTQKKSERSNDLVPIVFGKVIPTLTPLIKQVKHVQKVRKEKTVKILLDSGANASIVHHSYVAKNAFVKNQTKQEWATMAGTFKTTRVANVKLRLPELNPTAVLNVHCHVTKQESNYDLILGRDILRELGIKLDFSNNKIILEHSEISMKPLNCNVKEHFAIQDSKRVHAETKRIKKN